MVNECDMRGNECDMDGNECDMHGNECDTDENCLKQNLRRTQNKIFKSVYGHALKMDEIIKALKDKVIPPNLNIF